MNLKPRARQRVHILVYALCGVLFVFLTPLPAAGDAAPSDQGPPFREVFRESHLVMLLIEPESGRIVDANPAALEFYGYRYNELTEMTIQDINMLTSDQVEEEFTRAAEEDRNLFIFRHILADGSYRTVEVVSQPYQHGDRSLLLSVVRDATGYRFTEGELWYYQSLLEHQVDEQVSQIRRLQRIAAVLAGIFFLVLLAIIVYLRHTVHRLRSTEVALQRSNKILQEVHHRIKNNMSTVVGLLSMEAMKVQDDVARIALEDTRNRVEGMMQLYETLYRSSDFRLVPMEAFLRDLVTRVVSHFPNRDRVSVDTSIESFTMDGKIVSPLGIVVTELVTNAMKYAFPEGRTGTISLAARQTEVGYQLVIKDDGVGFPQSSSDDADGTGFQSEGFGLGLVEMLVKQVNGKLAHRSSRSRGTQFTITIPRQP